MKKIIALLLGIALTAVALSGCGARAQAAGIGDNGKELVDFNIGHLPATGHILYFIAYEEGFFKEEGLNVTLTQYSNNTEELAALEAGKLDVAPINATNLIKFLGEGHEVTSFGGVMSDGHALVVDPDVVEGLSEDEYRRNLEVLKGKTIVLQANSTYDIEFRIALKEAGFDLEKDITILTADSGTDAYNSLKNKEIDGAAVYAPFRQIALNEGYVPVIYCDEVEYFEHPICCREVTLTENIEKDPDKYVSFTRAMIKASVFLLEDHEKSIEDALKYLDVDKAILTEDTYNHSINNPDPDEAKTITFYNAMKELGYIENEVNVKDYINNSIYEKALDSLINEDPDNTYLKDLKQYHEGALYAGSSSALDDCCEEADDCCNETADCCG
ncbi:MAG: ABC transporter substrate-binding protein [Lachnospiraceae bacterium]|nr:ABC transporter substrate-binding protein [Lachnospiraceae bacterium]